MDVMATLEGHYRDMCDIEFTIEKGKLWILQTRIGKRTAFAEWVMAYDMLDEGLIDEDEALLRVDANRLEELFKRRVKADGARPIAKGLNASPGAATGGVVFTADDAQERANAGDKVVLVRRETTPDDYHGMIASQGILTSAGGTNSHAAVVARGEGIPAVCGADAIKLDPAAKTFTANGTTVREGEVVTIDGFTGNVYVGELPLEESVLEKARSGDEKARGEKIWKAFERLMGVADARRRLRVRANADTPDQSSNARDRGAEGIGLCRTEHMFLGEERVGAVRQMIFAETEAEEQRAYDALLPLQREDFVGIFRAMDGLPVTVRLLDPPLHEFLPNQVELAVGVARAEERGEGEVRLRDERVPLDEARVILGKVDQLHEANPMLGLRGVRLGIVKPGLYAMQVRAICEAAARVKQEGGDPKVEIMIPLVATKPELEQMRAELEPVAAEVLRAEGVQLDHLEWGTMIELPRATVTSGEIAEAAEFFSFGTNDLTQTAFGFSRDDIGKFVGMYEERKLVPANPFVTIDQPGVGRLMRIAVEEGRAANAAPARGHLRRARRRSCIGRVLPPPRARLRELLAVPGRDGPPRRRPGRRGCDGVRVDLMDYPYRLVHLLRLVGELWVMRDDSDDLPDDLPASGHEIAANEEARNLRVRRLSQIGSLEVFPAGIAVLPETEAGPTLTEVVVAVTNDDFVLLDADVEADPDGELGRIGRAEVAGLRMVDEQGQPVAMQQSRDVLELDEPASRRYVVSVDRRAGDGIASHAFVFRSLSVADEARRDFERNIASA